MNTRKHTRSPDFLEQETCARAAAESATRRYFGRALIDNSTGLIPLTGRGSIDASRFVYEIYTVVDGQYDKAFTVIVDEF
jgi:hypothetical protein